MFDLHGGHKYGERRCGLTRTPCSFLGVTHLKLIYACLNIGITKHPMAIS